MQEYMRQLRLRQLVARRVADDDRAAGSGQTTDRLQQRGAVGVVELAEGVRYRNEVERSGRKGHRQGIHRFEPDAREIRESSLELRCAGVVNIDRDDLIVGTEAVDQKANKFA